MASSARVNSLRPGIILLAWVYVGMGSSGGAHANPAYCEISSEAERWEVKGRGFITQEEMSWVFSLTPPPGHVLYDLPFKDDLLEDLLKYEVTKPFRTPTLRFKSRNPDVSLQLFLTNPFSPARWNFELWNLVGSGLESLFVPEKFKKDDGYTDREHLVDGREAAREIPKIFGSMSRIEPKPGEFSLTLGMYIPKYKRTISFMDRRPLDCTPNP